jgi:hypothetical protein
MAPSHGGSSAGKSGLCCGRSFDVAGRPGWHQFGFMSICFADCPSPGPRKNDLTIYWALGPFVRSFTLLVDPGDICPPQRRTVAAQLGCNIPPSSSLSWRGRERGLAGALWSGPLFGFDGWFASLERECEREPSGGRVRPGTMAAAVEVIGESPRTRRPAGSPVWRLFIPVGTEPEFRL